VIGLENNTHRQVFDRFCKKWYNCLKRLQLMPEVKFLISWQMVYLFKNEVTTFVRLKE
jgi:hypothetical protein